MECKGITVILQGTWQVRITLCHPVHVHQGLCYPSMDIVPAKTLVKRLGRSPEEGKPVKMGGLPYSVDKNQGRASRFTTGSRWAPVARGTH